jgi:broad specificity phosphatase PhoE
VSDQAPPVYFVRHGETEWNRQSRIQGQIDIPLNDTGHRQSARVARLLKDHLGARRIDRFIVSPLTRARQTMDHISRAFDFSPTRLEVVPEVSELAFGIWEGRYLHELANHPGCPKDWRSHFHWRPQDGESYEDGLSRIRQWIGRFDGPTVIVSHGAIGRCLIGLLSVLAPQDLVRLPTPQGTFCRVENGEIDWFNTEEVGEEV